MESFLNGIKEKIGDNDDFFTQLDFLFHKEVSLVGLSTMIDLSKTKEALYQNVRRISFQEPNSETIWCILGEVVNGEMKKAIKAIFEGKLIIYIQNTNQYIIHDPVPKTLNRSIEPPMNENVVQGPLNSFIEDIDTNIGLLRKQIDSEQLFVRSFTTGTKYHKKISLLFINEIVDKDLVDRITEQIEKHKDRDISDLQGLSSMLKSSKWDTVFKFNTTELPNHAIQYLKRGRVVLFVDNLPIALIFPNLLWDMFVVENDRNFPYPIMTAIRCIRVIGILVTLISPGLYVALVAVNPEVLQIELALSVAQSREGVPYPAIVEVIIMLVILELILEASIRLPKSIGPTITMVGGIILGQAVVEAKLVSNLLIIILAATTIANSTIAGAQGSISVRVFKYLNVLLSAIYGVLGLATGIVLISAYVASLNTFGNSYLHIRLERNEQSR
jgi:hypothetical protein